MKITNDIKYVGVNDKTVDKFEGQYSVPHGMSYNSYVILDEKIAVMDTVGEGFGEEWLTNIERELCGREPDYLVVHHMEPDHSANVSAFLDKYPSARAVATDKAFLMIKQFFGEGYGDGGLTVKTGDSLSLGKHTLRFIAAPMVHWPEVTLSYDECDKVLFSADAFGKFGALDTDEPWEDEARRYYIGIVGKYGAQVQKLLAAAGELEISAICPLHGPILTEDIGRYISLYNVWSSYSVESEGAVIAYTSVYGNTRKAVMLLRDELLAAGCPCVEVYDLARCDTSEAIAAAFRYGKLVLATTTYNSDVFPYMHGFIHGLCERGFRSRTVALIENGSWAPVAAKVMRSQLEGCRDISFAENTVSIRSALTKENAAQIKALAGELCR